ncbi:YARHG domain-containing protein [Paenibacillus sp. HN-1]|uniref:YARHG domain-containing protein n=1 Tax=Paenibacillus TaxID=44249 RepID=UPI001CA9AFC3|nr:MULTISPECIES: YARHG domain-containing protein [Paenibacillus]MBY9079464.1 YARHG domain-containing protein [Paenibacillus sp. CGMCC 1.18879]MBY9083445.1 YARHG domain-containing protein [Paenibacillus sinensis]
MKGIKRAGVLLSLFALLAGIGNAEAAGSKPDFNKLVNYIIPDSDKLRLTTQDVYDLTPWRLDYARNEIYARHGYVFASSYYSSYFALRPWYKKNPAFKINQLSSVEQANVLFLKNISDKLKAGFRKVQGSQTSLDLNGDGRKDSVSLKAVAGGEAYKLTVNQSSVTGTGDNLDGVMYVADLDRNDKFKEIVITESGPSDDYSAYFYMYTGSKLIYMGKIQGSESVIKIDGSGRLLTKTRGDVLQTWFFTDEYKLSASHQLVRVPHSYYKMNTVVTVKKQLKLQKSPSDSSTAVTLRPGEKALIEETDNRSWCSVVTKDGLKGWFKVSGFDRVNGLSASDYFDGLSYAD